MVDVCVKFRLGRKEWTHKFRVDRGSTVRKLKEIMLKSRGAEEDLASFELRRGVAGLPDTESLWEDESLSFRYLSERRRAKRAASVEVVVQHASDKASSIKVLVPPNATILDVRREVMNRLGEKHPSEVRLVEKAGQPLRESEPLGQRRTLLSQGRSLRPALTFERAMSLQQRLLTAFSEEEFQHKLEALESEHGRGSKQFLVKRQALALSVQRRVLPDYGFEGSHKGVVDMMQAMAPHGYALQEGGVRIEELLRYRDPPTPTDLTVTVQWDPLDPSKEATLTLPAGSTVRHVKESLCHGDPTGTAKPEQFSLVAVKQPKKVLEDSAAVLASWGSLRLLPV